MSAVPAWQEPVVSQHPAQFVGPHGWQLSIAGMVVVKLGKAPSL